MKTEEQEVICMCECLHTYKHTGGWESEHVFRDLRNLNKCFVNIERQSTKNKGEFPYSYDANKVEK